MQSFSEVITESSREKLFDQRQKLFVKKFGKDNQVFSVEKVHGYTVECYLKMQQAESFYGTTLQYDSIRDHMIVTLSLPEFKPTHSSKSQDDNFFTDMGALMKIAKKICDKISEKTGAHCSPGIVGDRHLNTSVCAYFFNVMEEEMTKDAE